MSEQGLRALPRPSLVRADDLGQRAELLQRMTLGDPLRAERDVDPEAQILEGGGDVLGCAGVDGAPKDDERAVRDVRRDLGDRTLEDAHRRSEELVHGGADHEQYGVGAADDLGVRGHLETPRRENLREQLVRAVLHERHPARGDAVQCGVVDVEDADSQAGVGEGEAQWKADVTTAAQHDQVERTRGPVPIDRSCCCCLCHAVLSPGSADFSKARTAPSLPEGTSAARASPGCALYPSLGRWLYLTLIFLWKLHP